MLRAKFEFAGKEPEELSFVEGESIYLLMDDESGWAKGRKANGEKGWFPIEYTEVVVDVEKQNREKAIAPTPTEAAKEMQAEEEAVTAEEVKKEFGDVSTKLHPIEQARYNVVREILSTEKAYHNNLNKIVTFWLTPLRTNSIVDAKVLPKIFCNIEDILAVCTTFLAKLEETVAKWEEKQWIGHVFLEMLPQMRIYEDYLKNHHNAIVMVNFLKEKKNFAAFHQLISNDVQHD